VVVSDPAIEEKELPVLVKGTAADIKGGVDRAAGVHQPCVDKAQEEAGQKWGHTKNKAGEFAGSVQDTAGAAVAEEIPAVDETLAVEEAPAVEEVAAVVEAPSVEETASVDETPGVEDKLAMDETPSTEVA
jgi:hypothetical protein